jgi:excisionase family DNA binding protein
MAWDEGDRTMPRMKKPKIETSPAPAAVNGTPNEVLTLAEAAAYLRLPEDEVTRAIHSQSLPGRLLGGEWRFSKAAIQGWLSTGGPTAESRKIAQMALFGKYKDDPELEQILEDAMKRRGRKPGPDGKYGGNRPA